MFDIREELKTLPELPGVYLMKNASGKIIYIGKARVLKNRVKQYFTGTHDPKTSALVDRIKSFEYIVTDNEVEALILESTLIKKHMPYYNILLKDDKSFPYLRVDTEAYFPTVTIVRRPAEDGAKYFGPFHISATNSILYCSAYFFSSSSTLSSPTVIFSSSTIFSSIKFTLISLNACSF
jgi:excinuclease ABC subunit C